MVLSRLRTAIKHEPSTSGLALNSDAEVGSLHAVFLAPFRVRVWVEWAAELPLHTDDLVTDLTLQRHVAIAIYLHQLVRRTLEKVLDFFRLLVILLLVLDLSRNGLQHL